MKKILLPTDFSDNAWSAAVYALKLYAQEECTFYFLHSLKMSVSTMSNFSNRLLNVMTNNAINDLNDLKNMAEKVNVNANHKFKIALKEEDLNTAIRIMLGAHNIDLIVMGTQGTTMAKEIFFGSNSVSVIKSLKKCPVLLIPDEFDFVTPQQIAFPTDYHRFYGEELEPLKQLAELYDSRIRILHINEEEQLSDIQNFNLTELKSHLGDYQLSFHWMPDYAKKADTLQDFIEELGINILVMINYKHSFLESIIKEPVIKKIGIHPTTPFLVIPCAN